MPKLSDTFLNLLSNTLQGMGGMTPEKKADFALRQQEQDRSRLATLASVGKEFDFKDVPVGPMEEGAFRPPESSLRSFGMSPTTTLTPKPTYNVIAETDKFGKPTGGYTHVPVQKGGKMVVTKPQSERQPVPLGEDRATFKIISDFNSSPQVRRMMQTIDSASQVRELVESDNPIAASAIPTYMARASGEVGALSEADKAPFGGSQAITNRLNAALKQKASGRLTPENSQFLTQLSEVMEKSANRNLDRHARIRSKQFSKTLKMNPESIFSSMRPDSSYQELLGDNVHQPTLGGMPTGNLGGYDAPDKEARYQAWKQRKAMGR